MISVHLSSAATNPSLTVTSPNRTLRYSACFSVIVLWLAVLVTPGLALVDFTSGTINFDTTLTGTYDSYFIGTIDHEPDYYASLRPQLSYTHKVGPTHLNLFGGVAVNRYDKNSQFDSEDFSAGISSDFPVAEGSPLSGSVRATYAESTQIDPIVNDRVAIKATQFSFAGAYRTGQKTSVSDNVNYTHNERKIYGNQTIASNRLGFSYSDFLEDTNLNLSHVYTRTQTSALDYASYVYLQQLGSYPPTAAIDQTSNSFNLGVAHPVYGQIIGEAEYGYMVTHRSALETTSHETSNTSQNISLGLTGPLLPPARFPKVDSSASISYQQYASQGINDSGGKSLAGNLRLAWNARERTRVSFGASRSQSLGASNFSVITTQTNFGIVESIGMATTLSGSLGYSWLTFRGTDRSDSVFDATAGLQHSLTRHWSLGAEYHFQSNHTNSPTTSFQATRYRLENYNRQVVSLSVSCHY